MRVLAAPDKFRGTLTAAEAARAIASGWRRSRPDDVVEEIPMADGGEGTLETLLAAMGGERRRTTVAGPLGDPVDAPFGLLPLVAGHRPVAIVEMARASGLALLSATRRDPLRATTRGTGELILAACRAGADRVLVTIGGSATTDGGAGMAQALGVRLLDSAGSDIGAGGAGLLDLARIDVTGLDRRVRDAGFVAVCDVDNPLTGPHGAAAVYGPQKGASPEEVRTLDRALAHFAAVVDRDLGVDVRDLPGAGAAGGLGAGLFAFLGARLRPGVEVVIEAVGLSERMARADMVVTGEGRFDESSLRGKVAGGVLRTAAQAGVPAYVLCGSREAGAQRAEVRSLVERFGQERAMGDARRALEDLSAEVASLVERRPAGGGESNA